jgi:hypothetical protein
MKIQETTMKQSTKIEIGAGLLAGAASAAAGYYYLASGDAAKNRKAATRWAHDLRGDVVRQARKIQDIEQADYLAIVDGATQMYARIRGLDKKDLNRAAGELKDNWEWLRKEVASGGRRLLKKGTAKARSSKGSKSISKVRGAVVRIAKKAKKQVRAKKGSR